MFMPEPVQEEDLIHLDMNSWLALMSDVWHQGEHMTIVGPTGSGKTTIVQYLAALREYVAVLAVKRNDDTLDNFIHNTGYKRITQWPPNYADKRVVIWLRPTGLRDVANQASRVFGVLDDIFKNGGWCVVLDDTGYITGQLGLMKAVTVLLNQARSSFISVIAVLTQASSIAAKVPTETLRQVRHIIMFPFRAMLDLKGLGSIAALDWKYLKRIMRAMGKHDFLYMHRDSGQLYYVHNS